ncbi:MAG: radical SAM protein [Thaumarchaeota archaeon]|nr:radical SAM protein [Nitrososphaerota archaeon]MBI3640851.1 radical SAM protein [Nitrososphaerota archaeon]
MLNYDYPLYRPPSEAKSLIFQVTLGCSFNVCSYCNMYRTKEYVERPWDEIKMEIDLTSKHMQDSSRIFLADGDALNLPTEKLIQIINYINQKFPKLERISCYAMPKNILEKSLEDLKKIHDAGLTMFYIGIESGSDRILKKVTKGATSQTIIMSCQKAKNVGYSISCMIILGLGGKTYSKEHIDETARVLSISAPDYVGALTLHLEDGIRDEFLAKFKEPFVSIDDADALIELENLVSKMDPKSPVVFRANHGSNAYPIGGTFPEDKEKMLEKIVHLKEHPELCRPIGFRGF